MALVKTNPKMPHSLHNVLKLTKKIMSKNVKKVIKIERRLFVQQANVFYGS
jgi:hypothetical protein